jgi:hypothetical protein
MAKSVYPCAKFQAPKGIFVYADVIAIVERSANIVYFTEPKILLTFQAFPTWYSCRLKHDTLVPMSKKIPQEWKDWAAVALANYQPHAVSKWFADQA